MMGANTQRLISFLLLDHQAHAGTENGNLMATYDQLEDYGLSRRLISYAIAEAEFLGLIRVNRGGRLAMSNQPSTYRLTFYIDRDGNPATNDWKVKTQEAIRDWKTDERQRRRKAQEWRQNQKQKSDPHGGTTRRSRKEDGMMGLAENRDFCFVPVVPPCGTASISRRGLGRIRGQER